MLLKEATVLPSFSLGGKGAPNSLAYFLSLFKWPLPLPLPQSIPISKHCTGYAKQIRDWEAQPPFSPATVAIVGSVPCTQTLLYSHRKLTFVQPVNVFSTSDPLHVPFSPRQMPTLSLFLAPFLLSGRTPWQIMLLSLNCFFLPTDLITCVSRYCKNLLPSDLPHTPPCSQSSLSSCYINRERQWAITTNKWQCGAGPLAVTLEADGAVQCTACTAVHCGRRVQAIIDLPLCLLRFVVDFKWHHLKQMKK